MADPRPLELSTEESLQIREALRLPRGRYSYIRASQISGIPERTVHDWAKKGLVTPDFNSARPKMWTYRDLVMLRLFAWFRHRSMPPDRAAQQVRKVRQMLEDNSVSTIRSTGTAVYLDDAVEDPESPQMAFSAAVSCLVKFDLLAPLETSASPTHLWGPNLVRPTDATRISPWVLAGEPCIRNSRIPTATLYALHHERGLLPADIAALYGDLSQVAIVEAIDLESKMRSSAAVAA